MSGIHQARDVLAKWRKAPRGAQQPWSLGDRAPDAWGANLVVVACEDGEGDVTDYIEPADARLIVGTAGNPELLDAIDGLLMSAQTIAPSTPGMIRFMQRAERIAAAIIAADERMSA